MSSDRTRVEIGETIRYPLPPAPVRFIPFAHQSFIPQRWLIFTVTPAMLAAVLQGRRRKKAKRVRPRAPSS